MHSPFIDNADLPDMQLISKFNKVIRFFVSYHVLLMFSVNTHGYSFER